MSCERRNNTGKCVHFQCPFANLSGYECVELASQNGKLYCEIGNGCVPECEYSYPDGTEETDQAVAAFMKKLFIAALLINSNQLN
jgi:hypothetical protein